MTVVAAGAAMASANDPVLVALAAVAFGIALVVGMRERDLPVWRALSVGVSMNVLAWAELGRFFGLSSIIGIGVGTFVFVLGIRRRPRRIRRLAWAATGSLGLLTTLAVAGFAIGALDARRSVEAGRREIEAGIDLLNSGEFDGAAAHFSAASASLSDASGTLGGPLTQAASVVPVVAQHRRLGADLSGAGAAATARIVGALEQIDLASLRIEGGTIDLVAVAALSGPFGELASALDQLAGVVDGSDSPWLVGEASDRLATLRSRLAENAARIDNARTAIDLAPAMLGSERPRRYLALFTTPAEARGLGGLPGNYAELTIDRGRVRMAGFGRVNDLEQRAQRIGARLSGPSGFLRRYGEFGFDKDRRGLVGEAPFRNLTMTPNFPWVGEVAAELYLQVTGRPLDGVIVIDPFVVAALVDYTDGVELTSVPFRLTAANAADFLLRGQYEVAQDNVDRIDALAESARRTFAALLVGRLPDPATLARDLGPLIEERRLLVWTADEAERRLLQRVGLLGEIPPLAGADGWSLAVTNAGGNKIDSYLRRGASYHSSTDGATGETTGTLRVALMNTAPATGLTAYVLGNLVGLPDGTSRLLVSFYSPLQLVRATCDGEPCELSPGEEAGWNVYSRYVDIPSGATTIINLELSGRVDRPEHVVTWTQPLALPMRTLD